MSSHPRHPSPRRNVRARGTVMAAAAVLSLLSGGSTVASGTAASPPPAQVAAAVPCFRPANGLDTCRDFLGASVGDDPAAASNVSAQFALHESRYGAQRITHLFLRDTCHLTATQTGPARRAGRYLFLNWRPVANDWSTVTGGDAAVNACIADMADDVRALGRPIFLTVWHEAGVFADRQALVDAGCPYRVDENGVRVYPSSGNSGTAADYRGMWSNVQRIFAARGATNVWWVYTTLTDTNHLCMTKALYPVGSRVDWIGLDQYGSATVPSYAANVARIRRWLDANSTAERPFNRRPWALAEWAWQDLRDLTPARDVRAKLDYITQAAVAVRDGTFPEIHMYLYFDNLSGPSSPYDTRIARFRGAYCGLCQSYYATFADLVRTTVR